MLELFGMFLVFGLGIVIGSTFAMLGAYQKIEEKYGTIKAKQFLDFMRSK